MTNPRAYARGTWNLKPEIQLEFARVDFLLKLHISFDDVSLTPTVEEKKLTDHNSFRQYMILIQGKRLRISRLVLAFILPTMSDTAYFGGITITK